MLDPDYMEVAEGACESPTIHFNPPLAGTKQMLTDETGKPFQD